MTENKEEYFGSTQVKKSSSNCKLDTIEYISSMNINFDNTENDINKVKRFLAKCNILVHIHTTQEKIAKFFEKNFDVYSINKIPVGYGGGFQWHLFIRNVDSKIGSSRTYLRVPSKEVAIKNCDAPTLEATLKNALKNKGKRKRDDIIKDIVDKLK